MLIIQIAIIKNETIGMCLPRHACGFSFYKLKRRVIGVLIFTSLTLLYFPRKKGRR